MKVALIVLGALLAFFIFVVLVAGGMYVGRRNAMVTKNEAIKAAWAQVDNVLERRADLIPNLVETVKGFAAHEESVFGEIAAARAAMMGAKVQREFSAFARRAGWH